MKKMISAMLAAAMLLALASCGGGNSSTPGNTPGNTPAPGGSTSTPGGTSADGPRDTYLTFKVGTSYNAGSAFYDGLAEFERLVEENTKGAVQVEVFGGEALGSEGEMAEGVAMGTVDACLIGSSSVAKLDSNFTVFSLPYLFINDAHVDAVFAGEPGQLFRDSIWNNNHVMMLDYWDSGFRHYSTNKCEINSPEDMKGQLIRIPDNPIQAATAAALGASTSTLGFKEVYLACSNGTVDGQEGPVFSFVDNNFDEVQKYMVLDGHIYAVMGLLMNGNVWDKLTEEDQQIVMQAAKDAGVVEKDAIRSSEASQVAQLKDKGMIINENPDKTAWRAATANVYDQFADTYGADLINQIKDYPF